MFKTRLLVVAVAAIMLSACGTKDCEEDNSCSSSSSGSSTSSSSSSSSSSGSTSSGSTSGSSTSGSSSSGTGGSVDINTDLPKEMHFSDDGERLETGGKYNGKFYKESTLETLYIDFDQSDFKQQLSNNKEAKVLIAATVRYKDEVLENVGVRYRGNTSYSRANDKKSWKLKLDWQVEGQDLNGYNDLKLNNSYEDESNMREVLFANISRKNIPSTRGNFMRVMVNGVDHGIHASVQQMNKDHVKEWFLDKDATRWRAETPEGSGGGGFGGGFGGFGGGGSGSGECEGGESGFGIIFGACKSTLNNLGANGSDYEPYYTLKGSDVDEPWQDLANAAYTMGTASAENMYAELGQVMDVDAALWHIAMDVLYTDDDSYMFKGGMDYYVYFDVATGRIVPIEYDGNSAMDLQFKTSWTPFYNIDSVDFPLMNILVNIPELRQRYLAHFRTLMEEGFDPSEMAAKIDDYMALIESAALGADIKQYSDDEFLQAVQDLKGYFVDRKAFLAENAELKAEDANVTVSDVVDSVAGQPSVRPSSEQSVDVSVSVTGNVDSVNLYYGTGLAGTFQKMSMDQGKGSYFATIPAQDKGEFVRYYIEAISGNTYKTATYSPAGAEHDVYIYQVKAAESVDSAVVINELMASNKTTQADETGEYGDWIELYNNSDQDVDLTGYFLTDEDTKLERWAFPGGSKIAANSTLIVWVDDNQDLTTGLHTNFKLSKDGESIILVNPSLQFADQVTFEGAEDDVSYARSPNGTGDFVWTSSPTFNAKNN